METPKDFKLIDESLYFDRTCSANDDDDLLCYRCSWPLYKPKIHTKCLNIFCSSCLVMLTECPNCFNAMNQNDLIDCPQIITKKLLTLDYNCKFCDQMVPQSNLEKHLETCSIPCSKGCGEIVNVWELDKHKQNCSHSLVYCNGSEYGCTNISKRVEIEKHQSNCIYSNFKQLESKIDQLTNENKKLELKINQLTDEIKLLQIDKQNETNCKLSELTKITEPLIKEYEINNKFSEVKQMTRSFIEEHKDKYFDGEWIINNESMITSRIFQNTSGLNNSISRVIKNSSIFALKVIQNDKDDWLSSIIGLIKDQNCDKNIAYPQTGNYTRSVNTYKNVHNNDVFIFVVNYETNFIKYFKKDTYNLTNIIDWTEKIQEQDKPLRAFCSINHQGSISFLTYDELLKELV